MTAEVEAAVRAYFEAVNMAIDTGDVKGLIEHSSSTCNCQELVRAVQRAFQNGGSTEGAKWTIRNLAVVPGSPTVRYVSVDYEASEYVTLDSQGKVVERFEGHRNAASVQVVKAGTSWLVGDFDNRKREPLS